MFKNILLNMLDTEYIIYLISTLVMGFLMMEKLSSQESSSLFKPVSQRHMTTITVNFPHDSDDVMLLSY